MNTLPTYDEILARRIERYWADRGHVVSVQLNNGPYRAAYRSRINLFSSNMVNGLPPTMTPGEMLARLRDEKKADAH